MSDGLEYSARRRHPCCSLSPATASSALPLKGSSRQNTSLAAAAKEPQVQNGKGLARSFLQRAAEPVLASRTKVRETGLFQRIARDLGVGVGRLPEVTGNLLVSVAAWGNLSLPTLFLALAHI